MTITITLNNNSIYSLDVSPALTVIEPLLQQGSISAHEQQLRLEIQF